MSVEFFLAANRPEDNTGTSGGAIDTKMRLLDYTDTDNLGGGGGDYLDFVSSSALDTQNIEIIGRAPNGTWVSETVALNGTSHVQSVNQYLHVRKLELASDAKGTITVAEYHSGSPSTMLTIAAGERGGGHPFLYLDAEGAGGSTVTAYEKIFMRANGADYSGMKVYLGADEDSELTMDLEMSGDVTTTGGSESTTNRLTEPSAGGTYSWGEHGSLGAAHDVGDAEDGNLLDAEAQGIWIRVQMPAGRGAEAQVVGGLDWSATGVS